MGIAHDSSSNEVAAPDYITSEDAQEQLGFWTRMGCTPESFKRRTLQDKHNQLNQTLKTRHLHMIAVCSPHTFQAGVAAPQGKQTNANSRLVVPLVLVSSSVPVRLSPPVVQVL